MSAARPTRRGKRGKRAAIAAVPVIPSQPPWLSAADYQRLLEIRERLQAP